MPILTKDLQPFLISLLCLLIGTFGGMRLGKGHYGLELGINRRGRMFDAKS